MNNKIKKIIIMRYIGGKFSKIDWIKRFLDYDKLSFIDLFGGSGSVILNIKPFNTNIYNDYNFDVYNVLYQIKNNVEGFLEMFDNHCYSESLHRMIYYAYKGNNFKNDLERAFYFFYLKYTSINGIIETHNGFSYSFKSDKSQSYFNIRPSIIEANKRLKNIDLLNKDYKNLLQSLIDANVKDTVIYADPPYFGYECYYKNKGDKIFTKNDHYILADLLNKLKCDVILSYYYFDDIEKLYPKNKWHYHSKLYVASAFYNSKKTNMKKPYKEELILTNFNTDKIFSDK